MKIRGLRVLMASHGLDAYIVPSGDAHSSEYVAPCDERRAWLTGFTGSAGSSSAGAIVIVGAWTTMAGGDAGSAGGSVAVKAESFDGLRSTVPPPLGPVPEGTLAAKAASFDMLGRAQSRSGHTKAPRMRI